MADKPVVVDWQNDAYGCVVCDHKDPGSVYGEEFGKATAPGLPVAVLEKMAEVAKADGKTVRLYDLADMVQGTHLEGATTPAKFLVIRDGLSWLGTSQGFFEGLTGFEILKRLEAELDGAHRNVRELMGKGPNRKVRTLRCRHHMAFAKEYQEGNVGEGRMRVNGFPHHPALQTLRDAFVQFLTQCGDPHIQEREVLMEVNHYYDVRKAFIGYHGDGERGLVTGFRLGRAAFRFPFHFQCRQKAPKEMNAERKLAAWGKPMTVYVNRGDVYFMSHKATGSDWMKAMSAGDSFFVHAAGRYEHPQIKQTRKLDLKTELRMAAEAKAKAEAKKKSKANTDTQSMDAFVEPAKKRPREEESAGPSESP